MKKKVLIGFMMVTSLFLTGCTSGKETVTKCELNNNSSSVYSIKATYNIYSKNDIVTKVVTKEEATSENKDVKKANILDLYIKSLGELFTSKYIM